MPQISNRSSDPPLAADSPQLIDSFSYFSVTDITVTDVGSNSGVLGRSGSGGLGGAAAGLGSSFFFGAIVDGSQETKGGSNSRGGSSKLLVECRPLYPPSTGISTPPAVANQTANNRERL